ncbi:CaiB/BaiF CoA transferase family protein [Cupriavidus sp. 2MCAB6]|uniref:CaiB/BaiF CoA transferase family protein n=1 Tax=Cupriavidus sp. 2MCAB6 TaxID=3232981 RepID=UPI003F924E38
MMATNPAGADLPLHGLKVLDFSRVLAGPFCTAMLADAGAEVIKVEPFEGDDYRHMGLQVDGQSANFAFVNRGKRSLRLDLKHAHADAVTERLAGWADVAIENFKPGVADRLGIGYARLAAINPALVYCSISGFGQAGPWSDRPAYDTIIQALSGLMDVTGAPEGQPTMIGESIADVAAGMFASWGVMAALWQRTRTGRGRHLDVAMYDCLLSMMPTLVSRVVAGGAAAVRVGNRHANSAPFGVFHAADGPFVLTVANNRLFDKLAQAMAQPALASDPRFATNRARKQNEDALAAMIEAWARDMTVAQAVGRLSAFGVPVAPVQSVAASVASEHVRERGLIVSREGAGGSRQCHVEQPVRFGALPRGHSDPAPPLGADSRAILRELGFGTEAIEEMHEQGAI